MNTTTATAVAATPLVPAPRTAPARDAATPADPRLPADVRLPKGIRLFGPYLLVEDLHCEIVAWRSWQVLTEQEWDDLPYHRRTRRTVGTTRRLGAGHVLLLTRRAGYLSWFSGRPDYDADGNLNDRGNINGGMIYKVFMCRPHRRRGVATAMLAMARDLHPDRLIRHSGALSEDGAAWAAARP